VNIPMTHDIKFLIAGGGFAGLETIAAINEFLRDALKVNPHLTEAMRSDRRCATTSIELSVH